MTVVLGIDTGGTYTDGVVLERESKKILAAAKSLTTHDDLIRGIRGVLTDLNSEALKDVAYVALSTTLATNAIVENKGCRVGLLLLGFEQSDDLPPCLAAEIPGTISVAGKEAQALDEEAVRRGVRSFEGKVDAVAISGIFSVRNPAHENRAKDIVKSMLDLPVIMAHELTGTIGMKERTNTVVLNAKLISVIEDLMRAVKQAMTENGMEAPLMIVKGDGSLMDEKQARERPIETILSGPAASIIGATYLCDVKDALVCDMGGTTTDVAILANGKPRLSREGADVGGWRTRISAVNAYTFGLGGDSHFSRDLETGYWRVGPRRSRPISIVAEEYPHYKAELYHLYHHMAGFYIYTPVDGFQLLRDPDRGIELSDTQLRAIEILKEGPHTVYELGKRIGIDPNFIHFNRLIEYGIISLVGFTPTDVLLANGGYDVGDAEAARVAAQILAMDRDMSEEDFYRLCLDRVEEKMCRSLLTCVLDQDGADGEQNEKLAEYYFEKAIKRRQSDFFRVDFSIDSDIVGIGAPIAAWLPTAADRFNVKPLICDHHDVANAIGAAAGEVMTIYSLLVQNHGGECLSIYAPWGKTDVYRDLSKGPKKALTVEDMAEEVIEQAIEDGKEHLRENMAAQAIEDYEILVERHDSKLNEGYNNSVNLFIETRVDVIAVGLPAWINREKEDDDKAAR